MGKIGIIGAMELEVEELKKAMTLRNIYRMSHMEFYEGSLNGTDVVVVKSGVGKINAAVCVQALYDEFTCSKIINTGVAGSLNTALNIGDIVVSKDAVHHDMDATIFGYKPGEVPQMGVREFLADEKLINKAMQACEMANPDIKCYVGRVASGDQFISSESEKERIIRDFDADCCEMEGAAIAQACYLNDMPFVIIRAISDKADGSAEMDYPTFEKAAAHHSAMLVQTLMGLL